MTPCDFSSPWVVVLQKMISYSMPLRRNWLKKPVDEDFDGRAIFDIPSCGVNVEYSKVHFAN